MTYKRYKNEDFSKKQGGKFDKEGKINSLSRVSLETLSKLKVNKANK